MSMLDKTFGYEKFKDITKLALEKHRDRVFCSNIDKYGILYKITYTKIQEIINHTESFLKEREISCGDRVVIASNNQATNFITFIALSYCGVTSVILDGRLKDEQLEKMILFSDVKLVLTDDECFKNISKKIVDAFPIYYLFGSNRNFEKIGKLSNVTFSIKEKTFDSAAILFTSGTTADMKAVKVSYQSIVYSIDKVKKEIYEVGKFRGLQLFPTYHIAGLTSSYAVFALGGEYYLTGNNNQEMISGLIKYLNVTHLLYIPKYYDIILDKFIAELKDKDDLEKYLKLETLSEFLIEHFNAIWLARLIMAKYRKKLFCKNFRFAVMGGTSANGKTLLRLRNLGIKFANCYSTTEIPTPLLLFTQKYNKEKYNSVGNVKECKKYNIEIDIRNKDENGIGEICVKAAPYIAGYFKNEEANKKAFKDDYFNVGDYGYIDDAGFLYVTGRVDDRIVLKTGEKININELEIIYKKVIPDANEFKIVKEKGADGYDEIYILIEKNNLSENETTNIKNEIYNLNKNNSTKYIISGIYFVEKLPITVTGKVKMYINSESYVKKASNDNQVKKNSEDDIYSIVIKIIRSVVGDDINIDSNSKLKEELGLDSITMMDIFTKIDEIYHLSILEYMQYIKDVSDIVKIIEDKDNFTKNINIELPYYINDYPLKKHIFDNLLLRIICFIWCKLVKFTYDGIENLPKEKFVICPNHQSWIDSFYIYNLLFKQNIDVNNVILLGKREGLDIKHGKFYYRMLNVIPIERENRYYLAMYRSIKLMNEGKILYTHPEGFANFESGKLGTIKKGTAEIAIKTNTPIVPMMLKGAHKVFRGRISGYKQILKEHLINLHDKDTGERNTVHLEILKPIYPDGKIIDGLTKELCEAMQNYQSTYGV